MRVILGDEISSHEDMFQCVACGHRTMILVNGHLCCEKCDTWPDEAINQLMWVFFNSTHTRH